MEVRPRLGRPLIQHGGQVDSFLAWAGIPPGRLHVYIGVLFLLVAQLAAIFGWFPPPQPAVFRRKWRTIFVIMVAAAFIAFRYF